MLSQKNSIFNVSNEKIKICLKSGISTLYERIYKEYNLENEKENVVAILNFLKSFDKLTKDEVINKAKKVDDIADWFKLLYGLSKGEKDSVDTLIRCYTDLDKEVPTDSIKNVEKWAKAVFQLVVDSLQLDLENINHVANEADKKKKPTVSLKY